MKHFIRLIIFGLSFALYIQINMIPANAQGRWSGSNGSVEWRVNRVCPNGAEIDIVDRLATLEPSDMEMLSEYVERLPGIISWRHSSIATAYRFDNSFPDNISDDLTIEDGEHVDLNNAEYIYDKLAPGKGIRLSLQRTPTDESWIDTVEEDYSGRYLYTRDIIFWEQDLPLNTNVLIDSDKWVRSVIKTVESCPDFDFDGAVSVEDDETIISFEQMRIGQDHIPAEFLVYQIDTLPSYGALAMNDSPLSSGDSFTLPELSSGEFVYTSDTISNTDAFTFTTNATYRVSINGNDEQASGPTATPTDPVLVAPDVSSTPTDTPTGPIIVAPGVSPTPTPTSTPGSFQPVQPIVRTGSYEPSISADGSAIAFTSKAGNLHVRDGVIVLDDNGVSDIFKRDWSFTGFESKELTTVLVSIGSANEFVANGASYQPDIAANGNAVAYTSRADNVRVSYGYCNDDTNGRSDVYVHTSSGANRRSVFSDNNPWLETDDDDCQIVGGNSLQPSISDSSPFGTVPIYDNIVTFQTSSSIAPAGVFDDNDTIDVLTNLLDPPHVVANAISTYRQFLTGNSIRTGNGRSYAPQISDDGRYVAYATDASNLGNNVLDFGQYTGARFAWLSGLSKVQNVGLFDTNGKTDIMLRKVDDISSSIRVSLASNNKQAVGGGSYQPAISRFGDHIAFESDATNLMDEHNGFRHIYVHDRQVVQNGHRNFGCTIPLSIGYKETLGNGASKHASISANGRYVAFESTASNLVVGDTNGVSDIFVVDRDADGDYSFYSDPATCSPGPSRIFRVSIPSVISDGIEANGRSIEPDISGNGDFVAFTSAATNLVPDDTNGMDDVFVHYIGFTGKVRFKKVACNRSPVRWKGRIRQD